MRIALSLTAFLLATSAAQASNMQSSVTEDLRRDGVPEECLAKMKNSDAVAIYTTQHDSERSPGSKNRYIDNVVRKMCER